MIVYQPFISSTDRVVWHGGESTQLYYEKIVDGNWIERDVQTLGAGIPSGMSEMHSQMVEYYNLSQILEQERVSQLM